MNATPVVPERFPTYVHLSPLWTRTGVLPEPSVTPYDDPVGELVVGMMTMPRRRN